VFDGARQASFKTRLRRVPTDSQLQKGQDL
jgi:hypothetical protein